MCELNPGDVWMVELFPSRIGNGTDECAESPVKGDGH